MRRKRLLILLLALVAAAAFLFALVVWAAIGIGCEDADDAAFDTVRCDSDRGAGWRTVQGVLVSLSALALIGGAVMALVKERFLPLLVPALAAIPVFAAVGAINGIELEDKPLPRLTEVRLLEDSCRVPCARGIPVVVAVDRAAEIDLSLGPARFEDIGGRQYSSGVLGEPDGTATVDAGRHELRVGGEILNPPSERGPLPPGPYEVEATARPPDAGNQQPDSHEPVKRRVTIAR